jgi:hypothetical protein
MEEEILTLKCDNKQKDEQIHRLVRRIQAFHNNIHNKLNEIIIGEKGREYF